MNLPLLFFLCLPIFATNELSSIEKDFAKAIETIDTKEIIEEFFKKYPELRERSELFKEHILNLAHARKIQNKSKEIAAYFEPVGSFIRKHIPGLGGPIASGIELLGKIVENGGFAVGKLEEMSTRYEIDALQILSTDEIISRALIDTYYNEILPSAQQLEAMTLGRESWLNEKVDDNQSVLECVKTVLSPGTITNSIADLSDSLYITDNLSGRALEVKKLQRRLKLGKLQFEFYVRTLQIKTLERQIIEKQKFQSWLQQYDEQANLVAELKEELRQKQDKVRMKVQKALLCEDLQSKQHLMESIAELKRELQSDEDHFQAIFEQYEQVKIIKEKGITKEKLSKDINKLKNAVAPLITLNAIIQNDISQISQAHQVDELSNRIKKLEGQISSK